MWERDINGNWIWIDNNGKRTQVTNEGTISSNTGTKKQAIARLSATQRLKEQKKALKRKNYNSRNEIGRITVTGTHLDPITKEVITDEGYDPTAVNVIGMSGRDPLLGTITDFYIGDKILRGVGNLALEGLGRYGSNLGWKQGQTWARNKIIADEFEKLPILVPTIKEPYLNVGWAPKQIFRGYHASNDPEFIPNFWYENWAVKKGAPNGVYIAQGNAPTSGFLTKRPYVYLTETILEKPMVQVGEIVAKGKNATRNKIETQALLIGADGIIYLGIRDNLISNQTILKTLNPDTRVSVSKQTNFFKDSYGREITPTPYPGSDQELKQVVLDTQWDVLGDYFENPAKKKLVMSALNWGEKEYGEFQQELLRMMGFEPDVYIKGPQDGFTIIGLHEGKIVGTGDKARGVHTVTLNRERIPDFNTAKEAAIHELGVHGKTGSMKASDFGKGTYSDKVREMFPRIAELVLKNKELADNILKLNKSGKFFNKFKSSADVEKYIDSHGLSWDEFDAINGQAKYFRYMSKDDELAARAYTGQLFDRLYPGTQTLNMNQLYSFYTKKSADKFKKNVLSYGIPLVLGTTLVTSLKNGGKFRYFINDNKYYKKGNKITIPNYPIVNAKTEGLSEYFKENPDVAGMAIGAGLNGIDGERRIVINPYSTVLKTPEQKEGLIRIERARHAMDENNYIPNFNLTNKLKELQRTIFKDVPYGKDDNAFKLSIISRILVGDIEGLGISRKQKRSAKQFKFK